MKYSGFLKRAKVSDGPEARKAFAALKTSTYAAVASGATEARRQIASAAIEKRIAKRYTLPTPVPETLGCGCVQTGEFTDCTRCETYGVPVGPIPEIHAEG